MYTSIGCCPKCGAEIIENEERFYCANVSSARLLSLGDIDIESECDFFINKAAGRRTIPIEQIKKLLENGKTDVLKGFTSYRTGNEFSASIGWDSTEKKIIWEILDNSPIISKNDQLKEHKDQKNNKNNISKAINKFNKKKRAATDEFLKTISKNFKSIEEFQSHIDTSSTFQEFLIHVDQIVLGKYLSDINCPEWLGKWIAKNGTLNQQLSYLFRPYADDSQDLYERVSRRSISIKLEFWKCKISSVHEKLLTYDNELYLKWANEIGFDGNTSVEHCNENELDFNISIRSNIIDWLESFSEPIIDSLWSQYVPKQGPSNILQGEIARCIRRLEHEYWKNGMINMGDGFYDHMVDKIKNTLISNNTFSSFIKKSIKNDARIIKKANYGNIINLTLLEESDVESALNRLRHAAAAWCHRNQAPIVFQAGPMD